MHSLIFQVSRNPIPQDGYAKAESIYDGELVRLDYAYSLSDCARKEAIKRLAEHILPTGMFRLNPDGESMTFKGDFSEWNKEYVAGIQTRTEAINPSNSMKWIGEVWELQGYIINPLQTDCLFINDYNECGGPAERSRELMRVIDKMTIGDKLYIGAVFDYHF